MLSEVSSARTRGSWLNHHCLTQSAAQQHSHDELLGAGTTHASAAACSMPPSVRVEPPPPSDTAVPPLSAAEALAGTPFFADLEPVELARLIPELEESHFEPGQTVYQQGEPAGALYLIRSGRARVRVTTPSGSQSMRALKAPDAFGESELLLGEPRAATVVALTPLALWRLPRERFELLVQQRPELLGYIAAKLARQLALTTHQLSDMQEQVTLAARTSYAGLDPSAQAFLRRVAVLPIFDADVGRALLGPAWSQQVFDQLASEGVFFRPAERDGWFGMSQDAVRAFLLQQLHAELGSRRATQWFRRAAELLLARDETHPAEALDLLRAARDWQGLGRALERHGQALLETQPERLEGYLRALPRDGALVRPRLVQLLAGCCAAQSKLEEAIETYVQAERRLKRSDSGRTVLAYQRALADLYERMGRQAEYLACRERVRQLEHDLEARGEAEDGSAQLQTDLPPGVPDRGQLSGDGSDSAHLLAAAWSRVLSPRTALAAALLGLASLAWLLPPVPGLSPEATRVLATVIALLGLSFLEVMPDYLLGLLVLAVWVVTGTLPPGVAAAGFASSTWFLLLASMAVGTAVERSGLLYRGAIEVVRRLPAHHAVRCLTLAGLGVLFTPGMPSGPARLLLAAPLSWDIAESLRYPARSGGAAGLALSTYLGFGLMGTLFLTGNPLNLLVYGLFPPEVQARMNWGSWFLAALPTHLVLFGLSMLFVVARYRPERAEGVPEATLALQRRVLGPLSRREWSVLAVIVLLLAGFCTQSLHRIEPAWIAVAAVGVLFLTGTLDDAGFRSGVNVSFLVYVGVILSFGDVFGHVQLDQWLSQHLQGLAGMTRGSPALFILAVALMSMLLGIALRPGPIAVLLALALYQTAASLGVNPWVVAVTAILATNLWLYPQQNVLYLTAYHGTGERAFSHAQARPLAVAYALAVLVAIAVSVPYWGWIGLIG